MMQNDLFSCLCVKIFGSWVEKKVGVITVTSLNSLLQNASKKRFHTRNECAVL